MQTFSWYGNNMCVGLRTSSSLHKNTIGQHIRFSRSCLFLPWISVCEPGFGSSCCHEAGSQSTRCVCALLTCVYAMHRVCVCVCVCACVCVCVYVGGCCDWKACGVKLPTHLTCNGTQKVELGLLCIIHIALSWHLLPNKLRLRPWEQCERCRTPPSHKSNFSRPRMASLPVDYSAIPLSILPSFL